MSPLCIQYFYCTAIGMCDVMAEALSGLPTTTVTCTTHSVLPLTFRLLLYMYMRKGLGIFLENCEKLAATMD